MSYTFRVIFEGVCAWVPDHPFFPQDVTAPSAKKVDVLLPDLSRAEFNTQSADGLRVFRSPHFALLKLPLADLQSDTTRRVDLVTRDVGSPHEEGILFLKREQIRFCLRADNAETFQYASWKPEDTSNLDDSWTIKGSRPGMHYPDPASKDQLESLW